jgi:adenosine deaminase
MIMPQLEEFIRRIPKAELHCHLEGSIQPATLITLAGRHDIPLPFSDEEGAAKFFRFTSLNQFIGLAALPCETLRTAADFETITLDLAADAARQGITYREVFFTYAAHARRNIPWSEVVSGIAAGRAQGKAEYGVEMAFIADIDRTISPEDGVRLVEMAYADRSRTPIIGIGLDSQESGYPAHRHKPAFDLAAKLGLHRVAHAGEDVGPESVRDALDSLHVERIDHGVRSIEDPALIRRLAKTQLPLTVCPLSNIALKVYPTLADHPFKRLMDAGVFVTINSDDPPMFHSDVVDNYVAIAGTFGYGPDEITVIARNSFAGSFLDPETKAATLARFDAEAARLRAELWA